MSVSFGVLLLPNRALTEVTEWARRFDEAGADSIWVADHLFYPYAPDEPWLDPWLTLATIATATQSCRLGPLVTTFVLHSPVALARKAHTLNVLSGGRLDLGIGAGGSPLDRAFGDVGDATFAALVERMDRGLVDLTAALRGERLSVPTAPVLLGRRPPDDVAVTFTEDANSMPPLVIGGQGMATLDVAARYADRWNGAGTGTWGLNGRDSLLRASAHLDERCLVHGRDPSHVSRSVLLDLTPETSASSPAALAELLDQMGELGFGECIAFAWADGVVQRSTEQLLAFVADRRRHPLP